MRWSKGLAIGLMTVSLIGICNALSVPDTIAQALIPKIAELPRNQAVVLDWTQMTGDRTGADWYVVEPNRSQISKWTQLDGNRLDTNGNASTAKLSMSAQTQKILFAKSLIGLDGSVTQLKIPDEGQISGTSRFHTLSPDGKTVAYIGEPKRGQFDELYRFDLASGQSRQITQFGKGNIDSLAWSPDSRSLVLMRQGTLYRVDADGGDLQALHQFAKSYPLDSTQSSHQPFIQPGAPLRWSPDGRTIALLGSDGSNRTIATPMIWLFDLQTQQLRPLFPTPFARVKNGIEYPFDIDDFVWSLDGQQIVLSGGWGSEARSEWGLYNLPRHFLYCVNLQETKLIQITFAPQSGARLVSVQKSR